MSNFDRAVSMRKKATDAMARLDTLEASVEDIQNSLSRFAVGTQQVVNKVGSDLSEAREIVDALIQLVGSDAVQKVLTENRLVKMQAEADASRANISKNLVEGKLVLTDKVTEKTLIVGHETKADGNAVEPGFAAFVFSQVHQEFKDKLLGQPVGASVDLKDGHKFFVEALYLEVLPPVPSSQDVPLEASVPNLEVVPASQATVEG